jgi:hypothetical protein
MSKLLIALFGRSSPPSLVARNKTFLMVAIARPWPSHLLGRPVRHGMTRHWSWPFVRLFGREWYFPSMLDVWRKGDRASVRVVPWLNLKRWLFTRCESCGKRLPYGYSPVSQLAWVHRGNTKSVVLGEPGCYHFECAGTPEPSADYAATDSWDRQWGHDDGLRRSVLHEPVDIAIELSMLAQARDEATQRYRERLHESRRELGCEQFVWKLPQELERVVGEAR